jgi:hypothetical protein
MNGTQLPSAEHVTYLGLHLDRKLTWHHHISTKRKQLGLTLTHKLMGGIYEVRR